MGLNVLMVHYPRTVTISTTGKSEQADDGKKDEKRKSVGPVGKARAALDAMTGKQEPDASKGGSGGDGGSPAASNKSGGGSGDDSFEVIVEVADEVANVQQGERRAHARSGQRHMSATESDRLRSGQPSAHESALQRSTQHATDKATVGAVADEMFGGGAGQAGAQQGGDSAPAGHGSDRHAGAAFQARGAGGGGESLPGSERANAVPGRGGVSAQSSAVESVLVAPGSAQGTTDPTRINLADVDGGAPPARSGLANSRTQRPAAHGSEVSSMDDVRSTPYIKNMSDEVLSEPSRAAEEPMTDEPGGADAQGAPHAQGEPSSTVVRTAYQARSSAESSLDMNPHVRSDKAPSEWDEEEHPAAEKPHEDAAQARHRTEPSRQQYDTQMDLDVDAMVREELKWLKADGYLAGNASFHQSVSGEVIFVTFPADESHAAFITTVFEELGIGRDFGSVLVVPVSGGESSYRHMGWNNPEKIEYKRQKLRAKKDGPDHPTTQPSSGPGLMPGQPQQPGLIGKLRQLRSRFTHSNMSVGDLPDLIKPDIGDGLADKLPLDNSDDDGDGEEGDDDDGRVHQDRERRKARRTRYMSLASKMRVDQILEKIRIDTRIDFDYVSFLVISSVLAVVGLSTNSAPTIVASMLISPIMGPVLAMAIAANVQKPKLFRLGVYNYVLTLAVCIVVGFVGGCLGTPWLSADYAWPTPEMLARGNPQNARTLLLLGVIIGTFSGAGVALSVLSQNSSSLVGVAISAALLPPMVNTGMTWAAALMQSKLKREWDLDPWQWFKVGGFSLLLALINTVFVAAAAICMFKLKEVAPPGKATAFWKEDLKAVRSLRKQQQQEERSLERFVTRHGNGSSGDNGGDGKGRGGADKYTRGRGKSSHKKSA